jgi:hypothetical protein
LSPRRKPGSRGFELLKKLDSGFRRNDGFGFDFIDCERPFEGQQLPPHLVRNTQSAITDLRPPENVTKKRRPRQPVEDEIRPEF